MPEGSSLFCSPHFKSIDTVAVKKVEKYSRKKWATKNAATSRKNKRIKNNDSLKTSRSRTAYFIRAIFSSVNHVIVFLAVRHLLFSVLFFEFVCRVAILVMLALWLFTVRSVPEMPASWWFVHAFRSCHQMCMLVSRFFLFTSIRW